MLINLSNHPSPQWGKRQLSAAKTEFGSIADIPFPSIPSDATTDDVLALAERYCADVVALISPEEVPHSAVHLMGEYTFCFALAQKLQKNGIRVVVSTSERNVKILLDGTKQVSFNFVQFRNYPTFHN